MLAIQEKLLDPGHPAIAEPLGYLGAQAQAQGRPAEALPLLERAVTIYDAQAGVEDREPECRLDLARALVGTGGDRNRALAEARKAAEGFRAAGDKKGLVEVKAFLARHER